MLLVRARSRHLGGADCRQLRPMLRIDISGVFRRETMPKENPPPPSGESEAARDTDSRLLPWETPTLRRLAAEQAHGGIQPCNDGAGQGGCNNDNHS